MISIIMCTHNGSNTIDKAIKSMINQTFKDFEFLICDDGSTDSTYNHILNFSKVDNRIIPIKNTINKGLQKSLNKCIDISQGDYIARMDDDDTSRYDRLFKQKNFLDNHKEISFVGSDVNLLDYYYGEYGQNKFVTFPNKMDLFKRDEFCHPTIMINSNVLKKSGGYSTNKKYYRIEDHELWLRLYLLGYKGANIPDTLLTYSYNVHSSNNKFYDYFNRFRLLLTYKNKLNIGIKGYFYIINPLFKILVPNTLRNLLFRLKYKK